MAQRKIQLLRSQTIYADIDAARFSIDNTFAETAGLSDGELVLARYYATETSTGGSPKTVVRSLLGIYNSKDSNHRGFTYITNEQEINSITTNIYDRLSTIEQSIDALDLNSPIGGTTGTAVTEIDQQNGQVSGTATAVEDLTLNGYTKTNDRGYINAGDSLEVAFSKIENAIDTVDVDIHSNLGTITVTDDTTNGGKNVEVNVDDSTITVGTGGALQSGLSISKLTSGLDANVKEAYVLEDANGNEIGEQINIYKDSSLKEVYLGTQWDTVNEETGDVRHILFIINDANVFISEETYNSLTENEKSVYQSVHAYAINRLTITAQEYNSLSDDAKELYTLSDGIYIAKERYISESDYNQLPSSAQAEYSATFDMAYEIKDEWRYLTEEEFTEKFSDEEGSFYHNIASQMPPLKNKDYWQNLNFVYILDDGTYSLVKVDLNKFLSEVEYGRGLYVTNSGIIEVSIGPGLGFKTSIGANNVPIEVVIDPSSDSSLTITEYGLKLDTTTLLSNTLTQVNGSEAISVSQRQNNQQDIELVLAGAESGIGNALEIISSEQNEGLYLASTWDCGEY